MIIPCIDVMGGRIVQLVQGERLALERKDPDAVLAEFADFPLIHVIDLDAAKGTGSNDELVRYVLASRPARVGGGLRTRARAEELLERGAAQVILGSACYDDSGVRHDFLREMNLPPSRVIIAADSRNGRVMVNGWTRSIESAPEEVLAELEPYCDGFLCTCIAKEGMLAGTDLPLFRRLRRATNKRLIAAGGITTLAEVQALIAEDTDVAIGMAIYTGALSLDALRALDKPGASRP